MCSRRPAPRRPCPPRRPSPARHHPDPQLAKRRVKVPRETGPSRALSRSSHAASSAGLFAPIRRTAAPGGRIPGARRPRRGRRRAGGAPPRTGLGRSPPLPPGRLKERVRTVGDPAALRAEEGLPPLVRHRGRGLAVPGRGAGDGGHQGERGRPLPGVRRRDGLEQGASGASSADPPGRADETSQTREPRPGSSSTTIESVSGAVAPTKKRRATCLRRST